MTPKDGKMSNNIRLPNLLSEPAYTTDRGKAYHGNSLELLAQFPDNSIDLVLTSPPFALQRKKEYGNKDINNPKIPLKFVVERGSLIYKA